MNKKQLDVKNDVVFKAIFGRDTDDCKFMLMDLLNAILGLEGDARIVGITYKNPFNLQELPMDKLSVMDIKVETFCGEWIDIEMQVADQKYYRQRSLYYWAKMYSDSIGSSEKYSKLKKCIVINIVNFNCIGDDNFHTSFYIMEKRSHRVLLDDLEIHYVELTNFDDSKAVDEMTDIEQWTAFLKDANIESKKKLIECIIGRKEAINMAADYLEQASRDDMLREKLEAIEKYRMDQNSRVEEAYEEGKEEGKEEGVELGAEQKAMEIAENLLVLGVDIDKISKASGLTEEEIIELNIRRSRD